MTVREEWAKVFVNTRDVDGIAEHLAARLQRPLERLPGIYTIVTPLLDLEVERNDDRANSPFSGETAFLFFPTLVWAHYAETDARLAVVHAVAEVLGALDELGLEYATAADFEDELPNAGRAAGE